MSNPSQPTTICHICGEPKDAPGSEFCSFPHRVSQTTQRHTIVIGQHTLLALARKGVVNLKMDGCLVSLIHASDYPCGLILEGLDDEQ